MISFNRLVGRSLVKSMCTILAILLIQGVALGQGEKKTSEKDVFTLEEIVVTSTYRDTAEMDTPIAINALDAEAITDIGATSMGDIFRSIPGLNVLQSTVSSGAISIRGTMNMAASSSYMQVLPVSAVYINDTPVTGAQGPTRQISGNMFDVERFELLKGPQGTLYGEGSMTGTLRYVYNRPDLNRYSFKFNAMTALQEESDDMSYRMDMMANIPLVPDKLALRAVGFSGIQAGWIDRISGDQDVNDVIEKGGRIQLLLRPTDTLSLLGSVYNSRQEQGGPTGVIRPYITVTEPVPGWDVGAFDELQLYNLTAKITFPWADLTSITSYLDRDGNILIEYGPGDGPYNQFIWAMDQWNIYNANIEAGWPIAPYVTDPVSGATLDFATHNMAEYNTIARIDTERFIQEFRLVSNTEANLKWVGGVFYKTSKDMIQAIQPFSMLPGREWVFDIFLPNFRDPSNTHEDSLDEWSVFGEASYQLTDAFEVTAGLRYTDMHQEFENTASVEDDNKWSPKFGLSWRPNEDMLFYTTASTGFRPGNVNNGMVYNRIMYEKGNATGIWDEVISNIDRIATFSGDEVINYDLGAKISLLDNRVNLDASVWYLDWKDMISTEEATWLPADNVNRYYNVNVGEAHSTGVDLRVTALVTEDLMVTAGGIWVEAELDSGANSGNRFGYAPEWKYTVSADYTFGLTEAIDASIRIDISGADDAWRSPTHDLPIPSYTIANLRVSLRDSGENKWRCTLFARNLFNEEIMLTDGTATWSTPWYASYSYGQPRSIGIELSYAL